jgi:hypothetical protein
VSRLPADGDQPRSSGLAPREVGLLHGAVAAVGGSGVAYGVARYLLRPTDPFALAHPTQAPLQHLHVVLAPLLVFALGVAATMHAAPMIRAAVGTRRRSGLLLAWTAAPMVASAYLLQVATAPGWRTAWVVVHVATSLIWLASYLAHRLTATRRPERAGGVGLTPPAP